MTRHVRVRRVLEVSVDHQEYQQLHRVMDLQAGSLGSWKHDGNERHGVIVDEYRYPAQFDRALAWAMGMRLDHEVEVTRRATYPRAVPGDVGDAPIDVGGVSLSPEEAWAAVRGLLQSLSFSWFPPLRIEVVPSDPGDPEGPRDRLLVCPHCDHVTSQGDDAVDVIDYDLRRSTFTWDSRDPSMPVAPYNVDRITGSYASTYYESLLYLCVECDRPVSLRDVEEQGN